MKILIDQLNQLKLYGMAKTVMDLLSQKKTTGLGRSITATD